MMGHICEKEAALFPRRCWQRLFLGILNITYMLQAYRDASQMYEKAWAAVNTANATIGYKLAFNYLKVISSDLG